MASDEAPGLRYEYATGLTRLTLCQPLRGNPIDLQLARELRHAVARARDDQARVVLLEAEGKFFSVGGDVSAFGAAEDPSALLKEGADTLHDAVLSLMALDAIFVSVVRGVAAGAGFALAAAADIVLASDEARFTAGYTKVGLTPDGGMSLLPATIGLHRALSLTLLNPVVTASELRRAGLITSVHAPGELEAARDAILAQLLAGSRSAQVGAKHLLRGHALPDPATALNDEAAGIAHAAATTDGHEGVLAFLEKRSPRF